MPTRSPSTATERPVRRRHRLPLESYADPHRIFMFTLCARQHGAPFTRDVLASDVVEALLWRKERHAWIMYCYCLMPDHLHFVVQPSQTKPRIHNAGARGWLAAGLLDQISAFKRYTTSQVWHKHGGTGPLWQRSSYDHALRADEGIDGAVHYVLNNPVRRGIVARWEDYPYSAVVDQW